MKAFTSLLVSALAAHHVCGLSVRGPTARDSNLSTQTTFQSYKGCNADQKKIIETAHSDALTLADAAVKERHDELIAKGGTYGPTDKTINFDTQASIDYFGPSSASQPYQERILDTFVRAIATYRGIGLSDWWYDRYVDVRCEDPENECGPTSPAYTTSGSSLKYPRITYCPSFFRNLSHHGDMVNAIKADKTNQMKLNVRNLRSRATTALHEWLHIRGYTSDVCEGGCVDIKMTVGGDKTRAYKAGRTKLLAKQSIQQSVRNNDNYVYFAMSNFMLKNFGTYPVYPLAWDPKKSVKDNQGIEDRQPGAPSIAAADEIDDSAPNPDVDIPAPSDTPTPSSSYPDWYKPLLAAAGTTSAPAINVPSSADPNKDATYPIPDITTIKCKNDSKSPLIEDCVHAFGSIIMAPNLGALHGKKGGSWWAGYVMSCAINIKYAADWDDSCKATLNDVRGYAQSVFQVCSNGGTGTVGGIVPFKIDKCAADIEIIPTDKQQPPQGGN